MTEVATKLLDMLAVNVTTCCEATLWATIWKFALALPGATVTDAGDVIVELGEMPSVTEFNAGDTKLTVQVAVPSDGTVDGEQLSAPN